MPVLVPDRGTAPMLGAPRRIHHVQLGAPPGSEAAARGFFVDLLRLTEVAKPAHLARRGGIWLAVGDQQLHIGIQPDFRPATKAHPAFEVADLDGLRRRLIAAGIPTREDEPFPGRRRFYADDPFGNRLEFLSLEDESAPGAAARAAGAVRTRRRSTRGGITPGASSPSRRGRARARPPPRRPRRRRSASGPSGTGSRGPRRTPAPPRRGRRAPRGGRRRTRTTR